MAELDYDAAVDNLIKEGFDNSLIEQMMSAIDTQTDDLIRQGKTNEEINNTLRQTTFQSRLPEAKNKTIKLFGEPDQYKKMGEKIVSDVGIKAKDVKAPTTMQNIASGPIGGAVETGLQMLASPVTTISKALRPIVPFGNLLSALEGDVSKRNLSDIVNPMPSVVNQGFMQGLEAVRSIDPSLAKDIEAGLAMSVPGGPKMPIKASAQYLKGKVTPAKSLTPEVLPPTRTPIGQQLEPPSNIIDVSPTTNTGAQNLGSVGSPLSNTAREVDIEGPVSTPAFAGEAPSAKQRQVPAIFPQQEGLAIEAARNLRDYSIRLGNDDLLRRSEIALTKMRVPREQWDVQPEQVQASKNAAIDIAKEARRNAEQLQGTFFDDPVAAKANQNLIQRSNQIINNNGIIKYGAIQHPSVHDLENFTADLNIIGRNKTQEVFDKVAGTKVVDAIGAPKTVYHGTPVGFQEFDIAKAQPGLYGTGLYFTEEPTIAGGKDITHLGYASPQSKKATLDDLKYHENKLKDWKDEKVGYWSQEEINQGIEYAENKIKEIKNILESGGGPNVRPVYLNIKNPFDIDGKLAPEELPKIYDAIISTAEKPVLDQFDLMKFDMMLDDLKNGVETVDNVNGIRLYKNLEEFYSKDETNNILKAAGYDGITHTGGKITGQPPHRVWIAFDPSQVVSKFDPDLYNTIVKDAIDFEYTAGQSALIKKAVKDRPEFETSNDIVPFDMPEARLGGQEVTKRATEVGLVEGLPDISEHDFEARFRNRYGNPVTPPQQPLALPVPPRTNLEIQMHRQGIPFFRIAAKVEAETGIPMLTQVYDKGRRAHVDTQNFSLKKIDDFRKEVKEIGPYHRNTQYYIKARDRISDILEDIQAYDKANNEVFWDDHGTVRYGTPQQMASRMGWNVNEARIASILRDLYDDAYRQGATVNPNQYIPFYSPKRGLKNPEDRFNFVRHLREEEKPWFQHPRGNAAFPQETDAFLLYERYVREWGKTKYLVPWQKNIAEPVFDMIGQAQSQSGAVQITKDYTRNYIYDIMGMPRDTAQNFNYTMNKFVDNILEPLAPKLADDFRHKFGDERMGEQGSQWLANNTNSGFLAYRPIPIARNFFQRLFALPLLPNGLHDIRHGMKQMRTQAGQDKVLAAGILGYVGDDLTVANRKWYSPMGGYQAIERGNRGSIYLSQHDGTIKDFSNGMSTADWAKKYRLHLYPKPIREQLKDFYNRGMVGDVRQAGLDNAAHILGDWAQLLTQFPYEKGGGLEIFKKGPIARQFGVFQSWAPMMLDYMINLTHDAVKGPAKAADIARIAKMFGYFFAIDAISEKTTGYSLMTNPITNFIPRLFGAPAPSAVAALTEAITKEWNATINDIVSDRNTSYSKYMATKAWQEFTRTMPGFVPGGYGIKEAIKTFNPPKPEPKEEYKEYESMD